MNSSVLPEECSVLQLATLLGISERSVREWAARGVIVRAAKRGRYRTLDSFKAYVKQLQVEEDQPSSKLAAERLASLRVMRQIREIKLQRLGADLLTLDEFDRAWDAFSREVNQAILSIPAAARAEISHMTEYDEQTMMKIAQDILIELARRTESMPGANSKNFGVLNK